MDQVEESDFIAEGFKKITDQDLIIRNPPKIKWGQKYKDWDDKKKIQYLEKLACSMNHAASLLQDERDKLNEVCKLKEDQINKMTQAVRSNNFMLQEQITKMNEQRQVYNKHVVELNAKIRELGNGTQH